MLRRCSHERAGFACALWVVRCSVGCACPGPSPTAGFRRCPSAVLLPLFPGVAWRRRQIWSRRRCSTTEGRAQPQHCFPHTRSRLGCMGGRRRWAHPSKSGPIHLPPCRPAIDCAHAHIELVWSCKPLHLNLATPSINRMSSRICSTRVKLNALRFAISHAAAVV